MSHFWSVTGLHTTRVTCGTDVAPPGLLIVIANTVQGLAALATRLGPSGAEFGDIVEVDNMVKWTRDAVSKTLREHRIQFTEREIDHGVQYKLEEGTPVDLYESTGKVVVRGKKSAEQQRASELFGTANGMRATQSSNGNAEAKTVSDPKVFIVYGHDGQARDELELLLLRMNIKPIILQNLAPEGKTIIEALIANTNVRYAVVLLTPDDQGHRVEQPGEIKHQARQNVVLELGMFLAKLGRENVAILHKGELELPSDINGLIYIPFQNSVQEAKNKLAASLQKAGFYIDIEALSAG